jgi:hypothetical protein
MGYLINLTQRIAIMKKSIKWLIGLVTSLAIFFVFLFLLAKPRIYGFTLAGNQPAMVNYGSLFVDRGFADKSIPLILSTEFSSCSFRSSHKIYYFYENTIRIYDLNYQFLEEIDIRSLGLPEGIYLCDPVKKGYGFIWWTAGRKLPEEKSVLHPHGIAHIFLTDDILQIVYYEIGKYSKVAVQKDGDSIFVFGSRQFDYEIYDTTSKGIKSQVNIKDFEIAIDCIFYDDIGDKIIVCGDDDSHFVIGYIKDQAFIPIDYGSTDLEGVLAGNTLFYHKKNHLYQYDPNNNSITLIFTPPIGSFYSSFWNEISFDQDKNVLLFHNAYYDLLGRLNRNIDVFNLTTKQYYKGL